MADLLMPGVGDVVYLRSGGQAMTVEAMTVEAVAGQAVPGDRLTMLSRGQVAVVWIGENGELRRATLSVTILKQ